MEVIYDTKSLEIMESLIRELHLRYPSSDGVGFMYEGKRFFVAMEPSLFKYFWNHGHINDCFPMDFQCRPSYQMSKKFMNGFILVNDNDWFWSDILKTKISKEFPIFSCDVIPRGTFLPIGDVSEEFISFVQSYFDELALIKKNIMVGFEREVAPFTRYRMEDEMPLFWQSLLKKNLASADAPIFYLPGKVNTFFVRFGDEIFGKIGLGVVTESIGPKNFNNNLWFFNLSVGMEPEFFRFSFFGFFDIRIGVEASLKHFFYFYENDQDPFYYTYRMFKTTPFDRFLFSSPDHWEMGTRTTDEKKLTGITGRFYLQIVSDYFPLRFEFDPFSNRFTARLSFGIGPEDRRPVVPCDSSKIPSSMVYDENSPKLEDQPSKFKQHPILNDPSKMKPRRSPP